MLKNKNVLTLSLTDKDAFTGSILSPPSTLLLPPPPDPESEIPPPPPPPPPPGGVYEIGADVTGAETVGVETGAGVATRLTVGTGVGVTAN